MAEEEVENFGGDGGGHVADGGGDEAGLPPPHPGRDPDGLGPLRGGG